MSILKYREREYSCHSGETILDAMLRQKVDLSYGCKQGICQACMLRSNITPPDYTQNNLTTDQRSKNCFLACQWQPEEDVCIDPVESQSFVNARVICKSLLSQDVLRLTLEFQEPFEFHAGQFVNLKKSEQVIRSYSIASTPNHSNTVEFHIQLFNNGQFSQWAFNELVLGDVLPVSEPKGNCVYSIKGTDKNLLLIGTGTGLAPLFGIVIDALEHGHSGHIHLFHGSYNSDGLYLNAQLTELSEKYGNFSYTGCVTREKSDVFFRGRANDKAFLQYPDLKGWRTYLCGNPEMVKVSQKQAFLNGALCSDIFSDAFVLNQ
ncbi:MAG: FAD-binding oxidoreductase [Methylococcales bacterium]|jgi:NAD(P)H-flavin reductase|nr:FAD-binding oxidoreductase [Methylococcales bacterium]